MPSLNNSAENFTLSDRDMELINDLLSGFPLAIASVMIPNMLASTLFLPSTPVLIGIVATLIIVSIAIKYQGNGNNINKAIYDSITELLLDMA